MVKPFTEKQTELVRQLRQASRHRDRKCAVASGNCAKRTDDLSESLQQQTADRRRAESYQPLGIDLKSVLTTLAESAKSLCGAAFGVIFLRDGEVLRDQAESGCPPALIDFLARSSDP